MTRLICITSGKGGVGKTSLASNLATALSSLGEEVIAIDANITSPDLGYHVGLHLAPYTLHDVLKGKVELKKAIYHHPLGFKVIPGSININNLENLSADKLPEVVLNLLGKADYIILDSAAGLGIEAKVAVEAADEILIVTNPDIPSVTDALRTIKLSEKFNKKILGAVVNRTGRGKHELKKKEIEEILGIPVLIEIPEDISLQESVSNKTPLVEFNPNSPAAVQMRKLAHILTGKPYKEIRMGFLRKLVNWLIRIFY